MNEEQTKQLMNHYNITVKPLTTKEELFMLEAIRIGKQINMPDAMLSEYINESLHGLSDDELAFNDELEQDMLAWKANSDA